MSWAPGKDPTGGLRQTGPCIGELGAKLAKGVTKDNVGLQEVKKSLKQNQQHLWDIVRVTRY